MGYIRDLEGYKTIDNRVIKPNCLIRSAQLDKPTIEQVNYLKELKVKRIIDLRNEQEAIDEPDIELENADYLNISLIDNNLNGVVHVKNKKEQLKLVKDLPEMIDTYEAMLTDDYSTKAIKRVIREIVLNDKYPTIIHCVTGKDRAGIIVAILLTILQVDKDTIIEDYLKQRKMYLKRAIKYFLLIMVLFRDYKQAKKVYYYYAIKKSYIEKVFETIDKRYNSFDNFIHSFIGLTNEEIETFRNRILM